MVYAISNHISCYHFPFDFPVYNTVHCRYCNRSRLDLSHVRRAWGLHWAAGHTGTQRVISGKYLWSCWVEGRLTEKALCDNERCGLRRGSRAGDSGPCRVGVREAMEPWSLGPEGSEEQGRQLIHSWVRAATHISRGSMVSLDGEVQRSNH